MTSEWLGGDSGSAVKQATMRTLALPLIVSLLVLLTSPSSLICNMDTVFLTIFVGHHGTDRLY